ncbi:MAG: quinolinate synthase NadA [Chloroflexi bacterium]|nr:quinolinate synthase NadA [Chloroflexota bacterium]
MENTDAVLIEKIENLKKIKNAVILAHNCQLGAVQDIADFVGDSLEVSLKAAEVDADVVVICGVQFIAETAHILRPDKTILIPELNAGCSMVGMITAEHLREKKKQHPGATVVCYIKSPAEVKAESDICCTASNAVSIVGKLTAEEIIFVPDQYLGDYVCTQTGRDMVLWPAYCPSAVKVTPEDIAKLKEKHPQAKLAVHLECTPQVRVIADVVSSTAGIIRFAHETDAREIIIGTETGLLHLLAKENPDKLFLPANERSICAKMKLITPETILWSLENMTHQVTVPDDIRLKAKRAIDKMFQG